MDRIKRLSFEVLEKHKSKFGESFDDNKKILDTVSIIRSKGLKNEIAGFITKFIKKEIREENAKQARLANDQSEDESPIIEESDNAESVDDATVDSGDSIEVVESSEPKEEES